MAASRSEEGLVFRPTLEQVLHTSFEDYIRSIEPQVMRVGIARIVAPAGWTPRARGYADVDCLVPRPVRQLASGARGLYRTCLVEERPRQVAGRGGFAEGAGAPDAQAPGGPDADVESLERAFWKRVTYNPPLYGADVEGSLFDGACPGWHCGHLNTVLQRTLAAAGVHIPGVTSPYLYWGSWRALFAWHTEDYDLYSVNYLHFGAPKTWYAIAPEHRVRFETAAISAAPELFRACPEFLRHKELLLSPQLLRSAGVPFTRITQRAREFVITAPGAYHAGFNHGFNCAESTNFATPAWIPVGAKARSCFCQGDTVHIDMRLFGVQPQQGRPRGRCGAHKHARTEQHTAKEDADSPAEPPAKAPRVMAPLPAAATASAAVGHTPQVPPWQQTHAVSCGTPQVLHGTPVSESRLSLFRFPLVVKLAGIVMKPSGHGESSPPARAGLAPG